MRVDFIEHFTAEITGKLVLADELETGFRLLKSMVYRSLDSDSNRNTSSLHRVLSNTGEKFVNKLGMQAIEFYCEILDKVIHKHEIAEGKDYIKYSIASTEISDFTDSFDDIVSTLIAIVRDSFSTYLRANGSTEKCIEIFNRYENVIFIRLKLYLFAEFPIQFSNYIIHEIDKPVDMKVVGREFHDLIATFYKYNPKLVPKFIATKLKRPRDKESVLNFRWGSSSPYTATELQKLSLEDLELALSSFEENTLSEELNLDGLADSLYQAVITDPMHFSNFSEMFLRVHTRFLRGFLNGIVTGLREHKAINWSKIFIAMDLLLELVKDRTPNDDLYYILQTIVDIIAIGINESETGLQPKEINNRVAVLLTILSIPDPETKKVSNDSEERGYGTAINTIHGRIVDAIFTHMLRMVKEQGKGNETALLLKELSIYLSSETGQSSIIRSVFGARFTNLSYLDIDWARETVSRIFLSGSFYDGAWRAYILYCDPYRILWNSLSKYYTSSLNEIEQFVSSEKPNSTYNERLVGHVVSLYIQGADERLRGDISKFFRSKLAEVRYQAARYLSQVAFSPKLSIKIKQKIIKIIDEEVIDMRYESNLDLSYMSEFNFILASDNFTVSWRIGLAKALVTNLQNFRHSEQLFDFVARIFPRNRNTALELLKQIISSPHIEYWSIMSNIDVLKSILGNAAKTKSEQLKKDFIKSRLISKGISV